MSFISKSTTVSSSVVKDVPTARVPIRSGYPTWKVAKNYAFIPSHKITNTETIQKNSSDLSPILKKSSNTYSLHQSSKMPCSVKSSTYSSVTTVKTIGNNFNRDENRIAASIPSTQKCLQSNDVVISKPVTTVKTIGSSKMPCSVKSSTYSSVTTVKTKGNNFNRDENRLAASIPSTQKCLQSNDMIMSRPAIRDCPLDASKYRTITSSHEVTNKKSLSLTGDKFPSNITHKSLIDDLNIRKKQINDSLTGTTILSNVAPITSSQEVINKKSLSNIFPPNITHKSLRDDLNILKTQVDDSLTRKTILVKEKSQSLTGDAFFPDITDKSILDDLNVLKTPVNDSLTRKTILSNVVPVTSLITKTHHYKETKTINDTPTPRNAIRSDRHFFNTTFSNIDNTPPSQVVDSVNSITGENIQDPIKDSQTPLTTTEELESSAVTSEDELSIDKEEIVTTKLSRQDTEPFVTAVEDLEQSQLSVENECSSSIPTDIDLTIDDGTVTDSGSEVISEEEETENTLPNMKITSYKDSETSEIIFPSSDIIINLPPLISPINSDNTKISNEIKVMIPDSTTDLITSTPRKKYNSKNKNREPSLRRKVQSRQIIVKRKIREDSSSKSHSDLDKTKKMKIDKSVTREPRKVGRPKKEAEIKRVTREPKKVGTPKKITKIKKSHKPTNKRINKDYEEELSTPRNRSLANKRIKKDYIEEPSAAITRSMSRNKRTNKKKSLLLLELN